MRLSIRKFYLFSISLNTRISRYIVHKPTQSLKKYSLSIRIIVLLPSKQIKYIILCLHKNIVVTGRSACNVENSRICIIVTHRRSRTRYMQLYAAIKNIYLKVKNKSLYFFDARVGLYLKQLKVQSISSVVDQQMNEVV